MTVLHDDDEPQRTGLIDQHGVPIYRVPTRRPVGFCR